MAAAVIRPYFDAVRDTFACFEIGPGTALDRVMKVRYVVDADIHDKPRHYAATTEDGLRMFYAPEIIDLDEDVMIAIITHEFGHAADFLYPCRWVTPGDGPAPAVWVPEEHSDAKAWRKLWPRRSRDQVEWAADGIAECVTGQRIGYRGECILQCFNGGIDRPAGLR